MDSDRVERVANGKYDEARIEALLTEEQVLSDSVARKRRRFTKEKKKKDSSGSTKRELTPMRRRESSETGSSFEDEEDGIDTRSATKIGFPFDHPEDLEAPQRQTGRPIEESSFGTQQVRPPNEAQPLEPYFPLEAQHQQRPSEAQHHQGSSSASQQATPPTEAQPAEPNFPLEAQLEPNQQHHPLEAQPVRRRPKPTTPEDDLSPEPPKTPMRKPKKQLTNGVSRNSSIKSDTSNRKKSLTDLAQEELLHLFNKTKRSIQRGRDRFKRPEKETVKRSRSAPHHITEEDLVESFRRAQLLDVEVPTPKKPTPLRPEAQDFVRQRRRQRQTSSKIIEVLDPKTSHVVSRKTVRLRQDTFTLFQFLNSLRYLSPKDVLACYRSHKQTTRNQTRQIRLLWRQCMFELLLIMVFCGVGGMMFKFTEGHFENYYKCGVKRVKRDFVDMLWIKSHNLREEDWKSLARTKLRAFEEELHAAHEAGMTSYSGQRSWSFLNGIVYSLSVITTIGYGHICPTTTTGRALTIVYSIIGIPLFLIALTDFGKLFTRGIKFVWSFVRRLYYTGNCRRYRKTAHVQEIFKGAQMMYDIATFRRPSTQIDLENPEAPMPPPPPTLGASLNTTTTTTTSATAASTPGTLSRDDTSTTTPPTPNISNYEIDDEFNLPISVALFILVSYIFIGAVIYSIWEGWKFFISFYFVFISMSTIGFGDYVPKEPICMIVSIVYLVFGLALMSMCINVVQEKLSDTFKQASAKIGMSIGLEMSESGSLITADNIEVVPIHGLNTSSVYSSAAQAPPPPPDEKTAQSPQVSNENEEDAGADGSSKKDL